MSRKRGQAPFAGTALRVLRTKGASPLFRSVLRITSIVKNFTKIFAT